ncbi:hypothetical protein SDC9_08937 [bioreactor metagenome]|uniref:C4-type zinc ribbon domain-containing protein n=1 Tax=bioreactor metagenome TaxID=1076179 RepID=A0A644T8P1_9ZZZZ|nr:hypothetical protein [Negativicutes bacterium]
MMREQLQMLWDLQTYEESKAAILQKKQMISSEGLKKTWQDIATINNRIMEEETRVTAYNNQSEKLETTLMDITQQLKKLEVQLYGSGLKNMKEMSQLRSKYDALKANVLLREDELLERMEKCDEFTKLIVSLNEQLGRKKGLHEDTQRSTMIDITAMDKTIADIDNQIISCRLKIDKELLSKYIELKRTMEKPIAKLKKEYCGGCHRSLPITKVEMARIRTVCCDYCGRILISEKM